MSYYLFSDSTFITQTPEFLLGIHHLIENFYFLDFSLEAGYGILAKFWQLECECKCSVQLSVHDLEGLGSVLPFSSLLLSGIWRVDGSQIFHCRK